jgi:hypothetical protein
VFDDYLHVHRREWSSTELDAGLNPGILGIHIGFARRYSDGA